MFLWQHEWFSMCPLLQLAIYPKAKKRTGVQQVREVNSIRKRPAESKTDPVSEENIWRGKETLFLLISTPLCFKVAVLRNLSH